MNVFFSQRAFAYFHINIDLDISFLDMSYLDIDKITKNCIHHANGVIKSINLFILKHNSLFIGTVTYSS